MSAKDDKDPNSIYNDREYLIKELKIECETQKKKLAEEKKKLKVITVFFKITIFYFKHQDKTNQYEERLHELKALSSENEKLKMKIKEFTFMKDKSFNFEDYLNNIEQKNKLIENSVKEKQDLMQQLEKIKKELLNEKERNKLIEQDRKRLEFENQDFKDMNKFEKRFGNFNDVTSISIVGKMFDSSGIINDKANNNLLDFEKDSFIGELTGKVTGEKARNFEKEVINIII